MLNKDSSTSCYRKAFLIRKFEERAAQLYGVGEIGGFCHLYIGQEAVAVGVEECIMPEDKVITSYRDHGIMLARGSDPFVVMSELLGRSAGCSRGKGGSMHMFDLDRNFFGGHGIVGSQVSLGTGLAFAAKYRKTGAISVVYMGDGAVSQGQVYESFNIASLWKLPVLYIIENNMYGMGTSVERSAANVNLCNRGESFDIEGIQADGMDVLSVVEQTKKTVQAIRSGSGPKIIEFQTYRFRGHSMSDPANYRTKDEVDSYKKHKDPLLTLKNFISKNDFATDLEIKEWEKSIKQQVKSAVDCALSSSLPDVASLYSNIYSQ